MSEFIKKKRKQGFSDYSIIIGECHPDNNPLRKKHLLGEKTR